ncbi:MAG: LEA type 2 family protein [Polyangiaceae bacterium]|nr:LEA type 2 family protein [Polyangiaceae bacterium]
MKNALKIAAAALALLAAGCVSKPAVTLHDASIRSASLRGVGLDVLLRVENDNSYDIQIRNVRAQVTIHERYRLAPIDIQPNQWLPAEEATIVRVPVVIPWQVIPPIVQETLGSTTIPYRVEGRADVTAVRMLGIERDNYPVDEQGSVRRQDLINAAAGMLR